MLATVTVDGFEGVPDGKVYPVKFAKGDRISGDLAAIAVAHKQAKEVKERAAKVVEADDPAKILEGKRAAFAQFELDDLLRMAGEKKIEVADLKGRDALVDALIEAIDKARAEFAQFEIDDLLRMAVEAKIEGADRKSRDALVDALIKASEKAAQ